MKIDNSLTPHDLLPAIERMWEVSARKIIAIDATADRTKGAPVHTIAGRYQPKGWTDWTQGFEYGSALLQFDATGERSFLETALTHALTSARYCIFYGEGRDIYDIRGRTAHEAIFNPRNGAFRCVGTQQGYSGFSTWTRGLSWAMCGFAEILEYLQALPAEKWQTERDKTTTMAALEKAAAAVCDFYLDFTLWDGIPYWDTGAPGLATVGAPYDRESDPENAVEPVDSSAAAIAAQGLLRFAAWLRASGRTGGDRYYQAGLSVLRTLLDDRYLSLDR